MAKLLPVHKKKLCEWLGGRRDFTLLYQATRDGCSAQTFHQMCDRQGPTVTVLYNIANYVFGGFTSQSWFSVKGTFARDPSVFIFTLDAEGALQQKKYHLMPIYEGYAIINDIDSGPYFGNDLQPFSGTVCKTVEGFPGNGLVSLGRHFDMQGDDAETFCGNNYTYREIEVYRVTKQVDVETEDITPEQIHCTLNFYN